MIYCLFLTFCFKPGFNEPAHRSTMTQITKSFYADTGPTSPALAFK